MGDQDSQFWMGQVDASVKAIRATITRNHEEVVAWQKTIAERLEKLSGRLTIIQGRLTILETKKDNPGSSPPELLDPEKVVTWSWIRKEAILPIFRNIVSLIVAYLFFRLTNVIP